MDDWKIEYKIEHMIQMPLKIYRVSNGNACLIQSFFVSTHSMHACFAKRVTIDVSLIRHPCHNKIIK